MTISCDNVRAATRQHFTANFSLKVRPPEDPAEGAAGGEIYAIWRHIT